jgi:hypothetical protein
MTCRFAKRLAQTAAACTLAAFCAAPAAAQCVATGIPSSCPLTMTLQFTARNTVRVTVVPSSFGFSVTPSDYIQGYTEALGHTITVQSNNTWTLSIRSNQTNWTGTGGARAAKPRKDLQWATSAGGPYAAMPGNNLASDLQIAAGTATAGTVVNVWYHVLWSWTLDTPGTYTVPIILLIAAP